MTYTDFEGRPAALASAAVICSVCGEPFAGGLGWHCQDCDTHVGVAERELRARRWLRRTA